ncbi:histidine phosphatase family protein [Candidatus Hodarchaeum mangrovi]
MFPDLDIYLIRHADPEKPLGTWTHPLVPLSKNGIDQAIQLGQMLKHIPFNEIISSPLPRSAQTTEILVKYLRKKPNIIQYSWLREIDLGEFGGKTSTVLTGEFPELILDFTNKFPGPLVAKLLIEYPTFKFPSGENVQEFCERVAVPFRKWLMMNNSGKTIGIVAHGGSLTIVLFTLLNIDIKKNNFPIFVFNKSSYTHVRLLSGKAFIMESNVFKPI